MTTEDLRKIFSDPARNLEATRIAQELADRARANTIKRIAAFNAELNRTPDGKAGYLKLGNLRRP
jgi:hypothetical protein